MSLIACIGSGLFIAQITTSTLIATDVIRAGERVSEVNSESEDGLLSIEDEDLIGREIRRTVYVGKAIKAANTQAPRLVKRNQIVTVKYINNSLEILISGRAMGEAAAGDTVSVMNLQSRNIIHGTVTSDGWILTQ